MCIPLVSLQYLKLLTKFSVIIWLICGSISQITRIISNFINLTIRELCGHLQLYHSQQLFFERPALAYCRLSRFCIYRTSFLKFRHNISNLWVFKMSFLTKFRSENWIRRNISTKTRTTDREIFFRNNFSFHN